jgi:hypothetical protein
MTTCPHYKRPHSALLLLLLLTGCFDQQAVQLKKCEQQTHPLGYPSNMGGFNADLMDACMKDAGYRFDVRHSFCEQKPGIPLKVNAYCYVPDTPIRYWIYRVEIIFRSR